MPEVNFRCIIFLCSALPLYALPEVGSQLCAVLSLISWL